MRKSPSTIVLRSLIAALLASLLAACGQERAPSEAREPDAAYVVAVNYPLHYFASRLAGPETDVRLPVPPDMDPANWQPGLENVLELQGASLVLLNGAGYSNWLDKVSLKSANLVSTSEAVRSDWIALQDQVTHSHGPGGEHAHAGYAFTTWMDMSIAAVQARAVAEALQQRWPQQADAISARLETLLADLDELDRGFLQQAQALQQRQIFYSHPVYQYFERRYQLAGHSLHWEPEVMPAQEQWRQLAQHVGDEPLFVWEAQPAEELAQRLEALGIEQVVVDPAANAGEGDWLQRMRANLRGLSGL
jgi:zinc transport system substrate-binding protein